MTNISPSNSFVELSKIDSTVLVKNVSLKSTRTIENLSGIKSGPISIKD